MAFYRCNHFGSHRVGHSCFRVFHVARPASCGRLGRGQRGNADAWTARHVHLVLPRLGNHRGLGLAQADEQQSARDRLSFPRNRTGVISLSRETAPPLPLLVRFGACLTGTPRFATAHPIEKRPFSCSRNYMRYSYTIPNGSNLETCLISCWA